MKIRFVLLYILITFSIFGQENKESFSESIWVTDSDDGFYTNPIINSDYSDPDVIRVGNKFYMIASSFNCVPGLPILESFDLVNWKLISYAMPKLYPEDIFDKPQHGKGIWAPCLRYHNNEFYIYYPDPDFGIYRINCKSIDGYWSEPTLVKPGKGLIDPTPLWDDDGKVYLVYAFAGSRAGIKSKLVVCTMNSEGTEAYNDDVLLIDGHQDEQTIEGPKIYKKNGFYYIFAPAGGVATGWQTVLRANNIYGPYEKKKVLTQGKSKVNGPHQGAWVQTQTGEDWFIHFQDKGFLGRVVHLQPMKWVNDWPIIGLDTDGDRIGEPVNKYKKPNIESQISNNSLQYSDEFNEVKLGLQWQWQANPKITWGFSTNLGYYILNCIPKPLEYSNLYDISNLLLQKFPSDNFIVTTKLTFTPYFDNEEAGLVIMGNDYSYIRMKQIKGKLFLSQIVCNNAERKTSEEIIETIELKNGLIYLKVKLEDKGKCSFYYSEENQNYLKIGTQFQAKEGKWIGAKLGFIALREGFINDAGNIKIDWIRFK